MHSSEGGDLCKVCLTVVSSGNLLNRVKTQALVLSKAQGLVTAYLEERGSRGKSKGTCLRR